MSEELKKYKEIYKKYYETNECNLLNLMIINEIECQLEEEISEEDYNKLFYKIRNSYLKTDGVDLWCLTYVCINYIDKLDDMSCYEIIDKSNML